MAIQKLYQHIASRLVAVANCEQTNNVDWQSKHLAVIEYFVKNRLPSGGGFDAGTQIDLDESNGNRLVFHTAFHHMNDCGMYDGWTEHSIIVTADLASGFALRITGRDRNDIKDYIADSFHTALSEDLTDDCETIRKVIDAA